MSTVLKNKKTLLIIIGIIVLAIIGSITGNKEKNDTQATTFKKSINLNDYNDYINKSETAISKLSIEAKASRSKIYNELIKTSTYKNLVENKISTPEFLPLITAINEGIRETYFDKKGKEMFAIPKKLMDRIKELKNGNDKLDFVLKTIVLSTSNKGGLPKKLVAMFERFRLKYKMYGQESVMYDANTKAETKIKYPYNMSAVFAYMQPMNKTFLSNVYQANVEGVSKWLNEDKKYEYPYLAKKQGYIDYVTSNNIFNDGKSKIIATSNASFWKRYDPEVKERILNYIANKDCSGLQKEFNIASDNSKSQKARTGQNNAELMSFIDENMRSLGCYSN